MGISRAYLGILVEAEQQAGISVQSVRPIKSIAGLQRAWNARNRRTARLYKRPYILRPALRRHLDQFERLEQIQDSAARYEAFRRLPALEFELATVDAALTAIPGMAVVRSRVAVVFALSRSDRRWRDTARFDLSPVEAMG